MRKIVFFGFVVCLLLSFVSTPTHFLGADGPYQFTTLPSGCGDNVRYDANTEFSFFITATYDADRVELNVKWPRSSEYVLLHTWTNTKVGQTYWYTVTVDPTWGTGKVDSYITTAKGDMYTLGVSCYFYLIDTISTGVHVTAPPVTDTPPPGGFMPPTATTLSPPVVSASGATLRGSVNPNGIPTKVHFTSCDPSSSPSYFPQTPDQEITGTNPITVSYNLTGLSSGTTYRYKVTAADLSIRKTEGECIAFTTMVVGVIMSLSPLPTNVPPMQTSPPPQTASGILTIVSNVSSYTIYANGVMMGADSGNGVATIYLVPGQYNILLQKSGCSPTSLSTSVPAGISQVQIPMTCQSQTILPPTPPATQAPLPETIPATIPPAPLYGIANNTLLFAGLGLVVVLLVALIVAMVSRGKRPPKIYSSR